tara:strand:+ start:1490 stop:2086 length:597 start_codon:yes stop_codon:yes gene_type:complete
MKRLIVFLLLINVAVADVTTNNPSSSQTNVSGGNTAIQSYEQSTTYQSGSSSSSTTNNNTTSHTNNKSTAAPSHAPSMGVHATSGSCVIPLTLGVTTITFGFSSGNYYIDKECLLNQRVKLLSQLNMKVAALSLLCTDPLVFESMLVSSTPCPQLTDDGRSVIGDEAMKLILERRKSTSDEIEQYRKYKQSLKNHGKK